jgi:hypothetical protein
LLRGIHPKEKAFQEHHAKPLKKKEFADACEKGMPQSSQARTCVIHPEQTSLNRADLHAITAHHVSGKPCETRLSGSLEAQRQGNLKVCAATKPTSTQAGRREGGSFESSKSILMLDMTHYMQQDFQGGPPLQTPCAMHVTCPKCKYAFPVPLNIKPYVSGTMGIQTGHKETRDLGDFSIPGSSHDGLLDGLEPVHRHDHSHADHFDITSGTLLHSDLTNALSKTEGLGFTAPALSLKRILQPSQSANPSLSLASIQLQAQKKRALRKSAFSDSLSRCFATRTPRWGYSVRCESILWSAA